MKKTTKGAIAAAAAGVLLLGGAGTVAYWSDSSTIAESKVSTGNLALSDADCGDVGWTYATGNAGAGGKVKLIVPGDEISKKCTFTVSASGDNLAATLTTPDTAKITSSGAGTFNATVLAEYTVGTTAATESTTTITSDNDGEKVTATITVDFPYGNDTTINTNNTQDVTATLDNIDVTLVQTKS